MLGEVPNTTDPVPVSSDNMLASSEEVAEFAAVVRFLEASVTMNDEADKPEKLTVPPTVKPPVPCKRPVPEFTPTAVTAPDVLT